MTGKKTRWTFCKYHKIFKTLLMLFVLKIQRQCDDIITARPEQTAVCMKAEEDSTLVDCVIVVENAVFVK